MTDFATVLLRRHAGRQWTLNGDDYAGLTMLDGGDKPSKASLDAAWSSVRDEMAAEADAKVASRHSALAKLKALGLTDAEVAALVGG